MHPHAFPRREAPQDAGYARAIVYAVGVHVVLALLLWFSSWFSWERDATSAAGLPVMDASLEASATEIRAAERALEHVPEPLPPPMEEVVEEETVPPPQPIPEPQPQDSPTPQQQVAQERIPVPDTEVQEAADRLAVSKD